MKSDFRRLAKGSAIYGIGSILNQFINILLLPLFTSYLSPSDYGVISVLTLTTFILLSIFSLGFGTSIGICYFDDDSPRRKEETICSAVVVLGVSSFVMLVLGNLFAEQISGLLFRSAEYKYVVSLNLFRACAIMLIIPFMLRLQLEERQLTFIVLTLIATLGSAGISVLLVVVLRRGFQGMIEAMFLSKVFALLLFAVIGIRGIKFRFNRKLAKGLLRYGLPVIPGFISLYILQRGNIFILQRFNSLEQAGLYSIGYNLGYAIILLVSAFTTAWTPFFLSFVDKKDEARVLFGRVFTYYVFGMGSLSLLFYIFARPVVLLLTTQAFHNAYKVTGLTASAQFLVGVFSILLPAVYFAKEVKYMTIVQVISAILFIGISLLITPAFGIIGAGVSLVLGYLIMATLLHLWNIKQRERYFNVQYEWKRVLRFTAMYVFCVFLMLWDKAIPLFAELIISLSISLLFIIGVYYFLLHSSERRFVANKYKWLVNTIIRRC